MASTFSKVTIIGIAKVPGGGIQMTSYEAINFCKNGREIYVLCQSARLQDRFIVIRQNSDGSGCNRYLKSWEMRKT